MNKLFAILIILCIILFLIFLGKKLKKRTTWRKPSKKIPENWKKTLLENVSFYKSLAPEEKLLFEFKVQEFILNIRITGVNTSVVESDKILVAASAIIPIFAFPEWKYFNLKEVLLYPSLFNENFDTDGENRSIAGMVGTGYMEGKMILSKQALHLGFRNESDKKNTAIHEFVHLIDKADGNTDGIPELLLDKQYTLPWIDLIQKKIEDIYEGESDINPYGATNKTEFFAVISEYFFERPKLLKQKHPKLYLLLEEIFNQNMANKLKKSSKGEINRNDPCPCGSGKKYKKCCGKIVK
ncbi:MAG: zinc-dependent peptidase [Bacteroidales bacterium]|nr:zinc-dependent peptidase [Bacteroidales bacterium]